MARPRTFEPEEALAAIKDAFWRRGYEATSMADIEAATGLKKQSLYRLFGDKRGMYLRALDHYGRHEAAETLAGLKEGESPKLRFAGLFDQVIAAARAGDRRGCFLCNASVDQAPDDADTRKAVMDSLDLVREGFASALGPEHAEKAEGLMAAYFGLRVMVRAGVGEAALRQAAETSLSAL